MCLINLFECLNVEKLRQREALVFYLHVKDMLSETA
jgi:hypothetical protein